MGEFITEKLLIAATKMSSQRHMMAIKHAFAALLPIIITGAFCVLFTNVVCSTTTTGLSLAKLPGLAWLANFSGIFNAAYYASLNFLSILAVILIASELGSILGHKETIVPVVAVASYVTLCDTFIQTSVEGMDSLLTITNVLPRSFTNAQGLFLGMIVAIVATEFYCKVVDSGKLGIKMPNNVPPNVARSFNVLIPSILTIIVISSVGFIFSAVFGISLFDAIGTLVQKPLRGVLTGLPGYLLIFAISSTFWFIGIHGTQVLRPVYTAIMLDAILTNTDLVANNLPPKYILNDAFISIFTNPSGAGCTIGLIIAILIASKRQDYKTVARISIIPGLFNINETVIFGLPIVLNPLLMIPFIVTPIITATFAYFMTVIGFCGYLVYAVPWTTPPLLIAWLASGGNIGAVITQALCIVIATAIYMPFVLIANRQAATEEEADVEVSGELVTE